MGSKSCVTTRIKPLWGQGYGFDLHLERKADWLLKRQLRMDFTFDFGFRFSKDR